MSGPEMLLSCIMMYFSLALTCATAIYLGKKFND